jgi:hypothetical protein
MEYKMFSNSELKSFRAWMADCPFDRSVKGAFDSKPRARDEEEMPESRGDIARMMKTIARGMSPENWAKWREELLEDGAEDGEFATPEDRADAESFPNAKRASDKGRGAMDMAFDGPPRRKSRGEKSFAAMFGEHAADIKTNSDPYPIASRVRA